jgi:hypothetical protein
MGERKIPDMGELEAWLRSGLTPKEASDRYTARGLQITPNAIAVLRHRRGWPKTNLDHSGLVPWVVEIQHRKLFDHKMLLAESSRRQGRPLSDRDAMLLENWKRRLDEQGAVIHYQADTEQGWWPVPRRAGVDHDLIREPVPGDELDMRLRR